MKVSERKYFGEWFFLSLTDHDYVFLLIAKLPYGNNFTTCFISINVYKMGNDQPMAYNKNPFLLKRRAFLAWAY